MVYIKQLQNNTLISFQISQMAKRASRSNHDHWLVGRSTTVLKEEFVTSFKTNNNFVMSDWFPFNGKLKLPTKEEVLKLTLFLRDECGRNNRYVKPGSLYFTVAGVVQKYWEMAGFETRTPFHRDVKKLVETYQGLMKSKNRSQPGKHDKDIAGREDFLNDCNKLFDVAHSGLEDRLMKDRILGNLGSKKTDLSFLQDQRGPRVGYMGEEDTQYRDKVMAQRRRRLAPESAVAPSEDFDLAPAVDNDNQSPVKDSEKDKDVNYNQSVKKSKIIVVEMPRDIMNSSLTQTLDRTRTSSRAAMQVLSSAFKNMTQDGQPLDLDEVILSTDSIERKRKKFRNEICKQAVAGFSDNVPRLLALHWDSKLMKDISNVTHEIEAILVSGYPYCVEGKIIGKINI